MRTPKTLVNSFELVEILMTVDERLAISMSNGILTQHLLSGIRVETTASNEANETHASDMNITQLTSQYQITEKLDSLGLFAKRMCKRIEKVSLDKRF